ncbi:MAG TPA: HupE/UreJ family protein [Geminicoccaceae bacterium]|nr:HupE/UreJ family protein [Geminicoccaceae bacterium]
MSAARIRSGRMIVLLALGLALRLVEPAAAHDVGLARAILEEQADGRYVLEVDLDSAPAGSFAPPVLPERCAAEPAAGAARPDAVRVRYVFHCRGQRLMASDVLQLPWQRQGALIAARWLDGSSAQHFFSRGGAGIEVPLAALSAGSGSVADAAGRYLGLGVEHILRGVDHLLFVLGLLLIVRGPWMLIKTVTAFTLAHSLTLALATLGLVAVPSRPVEAAIALSIVFLAAEILRARQGRIGLTHRFPWLIAFAFGLLHGLGFAGALAEVGLPAGEIPLALLFFNLGVEIGQLMFIAAVVSARWAARRLAAVWPAWAEPLPAYVIGTVASVWFIERVSAIAFAS